MKNAKIAALWISIAFAVSGCSAVQHTLNTVTSQDSAAVAMVKNGTVQACAKATVGEMADAFLSYPTWSDFTATDGSTIVELEGGMTYANAPTTARIQFTINWTTNTFEGTWLGFDDQGQSLLMLGTLLTKMCDAV